MAQMKIEDIRAMSPDQQDDAVIETFLADLPVFRDANAETFDVLAIERGNCQNRDLVASFLFELRELRFQHTHLILTHDSGVVVDSAA